VQQEEKPDLRPILDHYDVVYKENKTRQKILCPVHEERVPSCSIDLDEGWYHCHACDAGGDGWNLIMEKERCDYRAAVSFAESIAARSGVPVLRAGAGSSSGILGRSRNTSRSGRRAPYRPRLFSDGRS
jgi:DNA primase